MSKTDMSKMYNLRIMTKLAAIDALEILAGMTDAHLANIPGNPKLAKIE